MAYHVVISMTSIPARAGTLGPTLASLRAQTRPPDEIRLYVGDDVPCPPELDRGCVYPLGDHGPVTKISAVLMTLPANAIVVTVDDDQIYQPAWLKTLLVGVAAHPEAAVGMAGWNVKGFLADPVSGTYHWARPNTKCDVLEGFAGVAYRPKWFTADILDPPEEFRWVDDVWISSYLRRRRVPRYVVHTPMCEHQSPDVKLPGIHNRPDFVELNRRASILGFGVPL
jgi:hypothetical protein